MSAVVFLHGLGGTSETDPFVVALRERFDVHAPLLPGFRDLADIEDIIDVRDLALWADDTLDGLGLDGATVIGHSFGGMVAAELAAHVPRRVAKLVLIDAFGLWDDDDPVTDVFRGFPLELADKLWTDPQSPEAQAAIAALATQEPGVDDPMIAVLMGMVRGMTAVGKFTWPIPDKGLDRRLRRVKADTLVLWGAKDKVMSAAYAERFAARLTAAPAVQVRVIDDAGHMLPYERAAETVDAITAFVQG